MANVLPRRTKFVLDEDRIPRAWYNIAADLPDAARRRPLHPGTGQPIGPGGPGAAVPDGADPPGGQHGARDRDPGPGARGLPALPARRRCIRAHRAREGARHAGPHLLQVRGREPGRQPQAEHGAAAGVLQQARRASSAWPPRPGAGQWGSALAFAGRRVRARGQGLHGPGELRPEAVPADPDGDLRRVGRARAPARTTNYGRAGPGRDARTRRARWGWRSARRSRTPQPATTPSTRWARCSTTCCSTRR